MKKRVQNVAILKWFKYILERTKWSKNRQNYAKNRQKWFKYEKKMDYVNVKRMGLKMDEKL